MCGRFYVDPEDRYFRELAEAINRSPLLGRFSGKVPEASGSYGGEVLPASVVPVLAPNRKGERAVFPMQWGYTLPPRPDSKKPALVINARSETAGSKPLFRESWGTRRCVIPATAYCDSGRKSFCRTEVPDSSAGRAAYLPGRTVPPGTVPAGVCDIDQGTGGRPPPDP